MIVDCIQFFSRWCIWLIAGLLVLLSFIAELWNSIVKLILSVVDVSLVLFDLIFELLNLGAKRIDLCQILLNFHIACIGFIRVELIG